MTNSIISHPLGQEYRYNNPSTKAPISKEEILELIEEKNKEISGQLARERNNFSEIVYRAKHHEKVGVGKGEGS